MNIDIDKAWGYLNKRTIIPSTVSKMNGQTIKKMEYSINILFNLLDVIYLKKKTLNPE